ARQICLAFFSSSVARCFDRRMVSHDKFISAGCTTEINRGNRARDRRSSGTWELSCSTTSPSGGNSEPDNTWTRSRERTSTRARRSRSRGSEHFIRAWLQIGFSFAAARPPDCPYNLLSGWKHESAEAFPPGLIG